MANIRQEPVLSARYTIKERRKRHLTMAGKKGMFIFNSRRVLMHVAYV